MKFYLLPYILLLLCSDFAFAQDDDSTSAEQTIDNAIMAQQSAEAHSGTPRNLYDGEQVEVKKFDQKKWREIVGSENYSELQPKKKQKKKSQQLGESDETDGKRLLREDEDDYSEDADSGISIPINPMILKIIFYSITFGIIGYILFLILKNISLKPRTKISKQELLHDSSPVADIKELEIDILLKEAMASGNYRLAIRIYFLGLLKKLDEDGFIVWKKNKTNRDYLSELFSKQYYYEELKILTLAYEQVWYGDHTLSIQTYEEIISTFKAVNQKINTTPE